MKIASILPYKENYTQQGAGAVALWISSFMRDSIFKKDTFVFGNTKNNNFLTKNYINIKNIITLVIKLNIINQTKIPEVYRNLRVIARL